MRHRTRKGLLAALAAAVLLGLAACDDDPLAPFEPEVNGETDNFQLQATGVQDVTATLEYDWQNTSTVANVDHSTTTTAGSARLIVRAADGTVVYDEELVPSLNEATAPGPAGDWTIRLVLDGYSGTLNFRLQAP